MNGPNEWKKKPDTVMAMRLMDDLSAYHIMQWISAGVPPEANAIARRDGDGLQIRTNGTYIYAPLGCWIVQKADGELVPMDDKSFRAQYEPNFFGGSVPPPQR